MSVSTAVIDGIATRYAVAGSGPPLLMFSPGGFGASMDAWEKHGLYHRTRMLAQLQERFSCIRSTRGSPVSRAVASSR